MPQILLLVLVGVLGLAIGSFLNVVIHRVPLGLPLSRPSSHCPHCRVTIQARHNVPVLSWLVLHGRCANCAGRISIRYPLVETGTAALFVAVSAKFGYRLELPAYLYLAAVAVALAVIDLDVQRLPHRIVLPSYGIASLLLLPAALAGPGWGPAVRALAAAAALYALYFVISLYPNGMGGGDVALAPLLGLYLGWLGWSSVAIGAFAGFLLGGVVGVALIVARRAGGRTQLPFGPFMLAGTFLAVFAGPPIAGWYGSLLVPHA